MDQTIQDLLRDTRFYELLLAFDREIADAAHASQCPKCAAKLHWGSFVRKPRGVPVGLGPEHAIALESSAEAARFQRLLVNALVSAQTQSEPLRPEQLHIAIVGAGATGVELAAEARSFLPN